MTLYTFGGTPADVLTDDAGNVVPNYPLLVKVSGTGATVTALFEADGTTPIATLRTNAADSSAPGAVRTFKAADVTEIDFEYLDASSNPVRWYQPAREVASSALQTAQSALDAVDGKLDRATGDAQEVSGPVTFHESVTFEEDITAPNLPDLPSAGWFMVTGAVGNGSTDDRAVIQAKLDAAHAAGGGTVFLGAGKTYGVSTFLVIYDNTTLWAYGATLKAIGTSAGLLRNFESSETFTAYTGHSHIAVLGGTWDGNAAHSGVGTVTAETDIANFVHCQDILVKDATFLNCSTAHGLEFNSTDNGRAINCSFYGFKDNSVGSVRQFSEAVQIDMAKSGSSSIGSFDNTPSRNIRVEGCKFGASDRLSYYGRAVGSHTLAAGVTYDNIQVLDCRIDGTLQEGMQAYGWKRSVISRNIITSTGLSGILATLTDPATTSVAPYDLVISDNIIDSSGGDSGIRVLGYAAYKYPGVVVADNVIRNVTGNAVQLEHCDAPKITGNHAHTTTSTGLYAHYSDDVVFDGNTVRASASNAINASGCASPVITGNIVDTTSSNFGIFIGQGADATTNSVDGVITGNKIRKAASSGIRLSTNATGFLVTGNQVRKDGGASTSALSMAASATGAVILDNDFSGNAWSAATAMSVSTAAPVTGPGGMTALPGSNMVDTDLVPQSALEAAIRPSGRYETTSRLRLGTSSTPTSGMLYLVPIWLPKGLVISNITFISGSTAAVTPTNWWFTLHNSSKVALARTADQTTTAWAANTVMTKAIAQTTAGTASSYTTTYAGLHYLGVMIKATTTPTLISEGSMPDVVAQVSPGFGGTDSGLSTPPTVTAGAFTAGAFGTGSGILAYGYVT
ncbi:right-handed parallel beta-helix repeat-containing protein [Streptomyces sp. NPDC048404]|uniref:right-handed parallel beta-helix repeat-containing protein n=1 Tax=unclassified Streptomyces TaxID=2593676 RepID=UPI00341CDB62